MGQYYKLVNITKGEFIHPHSFSEGAKLLEFGTGRYGSMMGLSILLASGNGRGGGDLTSDKQVVGSWAGDQIVIAGDYGDTGLFVPEGVNLNLYDYASENYRDISGLVWEALLDDSYIYSVAETMVKEDYVSDSCKDILVNFISVTNPK
jgi:hypothetical protein